MSVRITVVFVPKSHHPTLMYIHASSCPIDVHRGKCLSRVCIWMEGWGVEGDFFLFLFLFLLSVLSG